MFVKLRRGYKHQPLIYGEVTGRTGLTSCTVNTSTGPVRRNHSQIRETKAEPEEKLNGGDKAFETVSLPESELTERDQEPTSMLPCSMRQQRPPSRFRDFIMD